MAESKLSVGNVEVLALTDGEGDFPFPLSQLFPSVSAQDWVPFRQRYPELFSGPDTWRNHYGCYVLRSQGRTILVDTGQALAARVRQQFLDRVEAEGATLVACHFPAPGFGRLVRLEGRRYWQGF